ncbi:hypothetical protein KP509_01G098600 [Ceratopteris richardii]|uniref:Urease accessory protein UreH-like transmembrane domain-containing protein n=2 Tax=Ceratopteris richardii TaxID=49495 RepID=A0A8T2VIT8_CERRI|nr:hypothetical protein KP509_01G098600 [Ceratopteris richardii]
MGMLLLQQWKCGNTSCPSFIAPLPCSRRLPSSISSASHVHFHRKPFQCYLHSEKGNSPIAGPVSSSPPSSRSRISETPRCLSFLRLLPVLKKRRSLCAAPKLLPLKFVHLLLLGLGVFFSFQLPAFCDLVRQGGKASATLHEIKISEIITSGWAGLMAGCLHTLTGPDHLAALAPLCIGRAKLESAIVGALWGCGHDAGQIIFGLLFLLLKEKLKLELLQLWSSRIVGITLLAIGAIGLKEAQVPVSVLAVEGPGTPEVVEDKTITHRLRTFATGIIYGLQPDALFMILPALALPSRFAGGAYLVMFLLGTVVAMGSYTAFIGSCGQALESRLPSITQRLSIGSSFVAIIFGLGILFGELFGINIFR